MEKGYIIKTARLGFRTWTSDDLLELYSMNSDPEVMHYFPGLVDRQRSKHFIERMQRLYAQVKYCYFVIDYLEDNSFVGFLGLAAQDYLSPVTPHIDIGWRLKKEFWNRGLATEGALACLAYGFERCKLKQIRSVAPEINIPSIRVMEKIGMKKIQHFIHPKLIDHPKLMHCVCYEIKDTQLKY